MANNYIGKRKLDEILSPEEQAMRNFESLGKLDREKLWEKSLLIVILGIGRNDEGLVFEPAPVTAAVRASAGTNNLTLPSLEE